jgi:hypothetical protein
LKTSPNVFFSLWGRKEKFLFFSGLGYGKFRRRRENYFYKFKHERLCLLTSTQQIFSIHFYTQKNSHSFLSPHSWISIIFYQNYNQTTFYSIHNFLIEGDDRRKVEKVARLERNILMCYIWRSYRRVKVEKIWKIVETNHVRLKSL